MAEKIPNDRLTDQEIEHLQNIGEVYYWNRELGKNNAIPLSNENDIDPMAAILGYKE